MLSKAAKIPRSGKRISTQIFGKRSGTMQTLPHRKKRSIAKRSQHWIRNSASTTLPELPVGSVDGNKGTKKWKAIEK
jgi:hypothetical protein